MELQVILLLFTPIVLLIPFVLTGMRKPIYICHVFPFVSTTVGAPTTSQAVMAQQQQSKASKKINYDALKVRHLSFIK